MKKVRETYEECLDIYEQRFMDRNQRLIYDMYERLKTFFVTCSIYVKRRRAKQLHISIVFENHYSSRLVSFQ